MRRSQGGLHSSHVNYRSSRLRENRRREWQRLRRSSQATVKRGTWDETTVREYKELMRDDSRPEVMTDRMFGILGEENVEAAKDDEK